MKDANLLERFDDFKVSQYDREDPGNSISCYRGIAQSGSAPALGAGCREFESLYPDHLIFGSLWSSSTLVGTSLVKQSCSYPFVISTSRKL